MEPRVAGLEDEDVGVDAARDARARRCTIRTRRVAVGERWMDSSQFSACASAMAVRRLPTPEGPAKIRLGGSVPRAVARASSSSSGR